MRPSFVSNHRVPLVVMILASLLLFLLGWTFADGHHPSLFAGQSNVVVWGLLLVSLSLSLPYTRRRGKAALLAIASENRIAMAGERLRGSLTALANSTMLGTLLGPAVGLLIWCLPLGVEPAAHKALAIVAFMVVYWITNVMEPGITALIGCYLFWAFGVVKFSVAFSGFTSSAAWFTFGALLIGQGSVILGQRIGSAAMRHVRGSPARLLFGPLLLAWGLSFLIPSPHALIATLAPVAIGIIAMWGVDRQSNRARGLFVILTVTCSLVHKMILSSGPMVLARGLIADQTGVQILWSQWAVAFLPAGVLTVVACYLTARWLYPFDAPSDLDGKPPLHQALPEPQPWTHNEKKTLAWLLLGIGFWVTDFIHHLDPALIAIGVGLGMTLPHIGVLNTKDLRQVNFLVVIFAAGALSMGKVLTETHALDGFLGGFTAWLAPLLDQPLAGAAVLYWSGFLYHFVAGNDPVMIATGLPVWLTLATSEGYNPVAIGLAWTFAVSGKLFMYQAASLITGYAYGYFTVKDLLKVNAVLTVAEGLILMLLASLYWPLIGLSWRSIP